MPAGRPPGGPAVPVASQMLDANGRIMPEYTQFLRELAGYSGDIADAEALAQLAWAKPLVASSAAGVSIPLDLSVHSVAIGMPPTLASYPLDIRDGTASQVHIASTSGDDGTYILSTIIFGAPATYISSGCAWDGSNWIGKNTQASILGITSSALALAYNSGVVVGSPFTPFTVLEIDYSSGTITFPSMRTTDPGAGSKQLWADPSDSYRVKFAF